MNPNKCYRNTLSAGRVNWHRKRCPTFKGSMTFSHYMNTAVWSKSVFQFVCSLSLLGSMCKKACEVLSPHVISKGLVVQSVSTTHNKLMCAVQQSCVHSPGSSEGIRRERGKLFSLFLTWWGEQDASPWIIQLPKRLLSFLGVKSVGNLENYRQRFITSWM